MTVETPDKFGFSPKNSTNCSPAFKNKITKNLNNCYDNNSRVNVMRVQVDQYTTQQSDQKPEQNLRKNEDEVKNAIPKPQMTPQMTPQKSPSAGNTTPLRTPIQ